MTYSKLDISKAFHEIEERLWEIKDVCDVIYVSKGITGSDEYIKVQLINPLPSETNLMREYKGFDIRYDILGKDYSSYANPELTRKWCESGKQRYYALRTVTSFQEAYGNRNTLESCLGWTEDISEYYIRAFVNDKLFGTILLPDKYNGFKVSKESIAEEDFESFYRDDD